jgi:hypothetical protein
MSARLVGAALLAALAGCASWRAPAAGPSGEGLVVPVSSRDKTAARREALDAVLPLFLTDAQRRDERLAAALEGETFFGRSRLSPKDPAVVEVLIDPLAKSLAKAGLLQPPGYKTGPEVVLIALGDRAVGPRAEELFAAQALETAFFGRGIQAQDANDDLLQLKHPLKRKTEAGIASEAEAGGWAWLVAGGLEIGAKRDVESAAWRASAKLSTSLYALGTSSTPTTFDAEASAVDVSSLAAVSRAVEGAAQDAAARSERLMARRRGERAVIAVLVTGKKEPAFLRKVVADLRRLPRVDGAALVQWKTIDDMAVIHVYANGLKTDELAGRLLREDASLRLGAVETEDRRLTLEGPEIPISEDRGN